ncbi:hypothetical protein PDO_2302 [Rhizobium sp. PDO1-076]|nr:hypothetical protein PDO_2302 [Rhizobium sp. PDO1-076]
MWLGTLLLNPLCNAALLTNCDHLLRSAFASSNRIEPHKLLRPRRPTMLPGA